MMFPQPSIDPDETDEERRARGRVLFKQVCHEAVALKDDDPLMFHLLEIKARTLNRLYGLDTRTEHQLGSIAALEDMVSVVDEEIERIRLDRQEARQSTTVTPTVTG